MSLFVFCVLMSWGFAQESTVQVQTYEVKVVDLNSELLYPAAVTPGAEGKLTSEVSGVVTRVRKTLGANVKAQETVFFVRQTQVGLEFRDYAVRSPIAGKLAQLNYSPGQYVKAGEVAGEVIDPRRMKVSFEAPAQDTPSLRPGLQANFIYNDEKIPLRITGVSPVANPTTGTSRVELQPISKIGSLRAGSVGRVTVQLPPRRALAVPLQALVVLSGKTFIRLIDSESKVHFAQVKAGDIARDLQVIETGLKEGDEIIVRASGFIKEGDTVARAPKTPQAS